jgi:hypothetical protein
MSTSSTSAQEKAKEQGVVLAEPIVHPESAEHLAFLGRELVLDWLKNNAPKNIHRLASLVEVFRDYQRQLAEFEGQVSEDANQNMSGGALFEMVNLIGEFDAWETF